MQQKQSENLKMEEENEEKGLQAVDQNENRIDEELIKNLNDYIQQMFQIQQKPLENMNKQEIRKSCNCKQSKCLKLYCECFAEGIYCNQQCNCNECFNNLFHEFQRKQAIASTLERNPNAFQSKFQQKNQNFNNQQIQDANMNMDQNIIENRIKHSKGCACKKSNCLKKYCECYQANTICSDLCKCFDCYNSIPLPSDEVIQQIANNTIQINTSPSFKSFKYNVVSSYDQFKSILKENNQNKKVSKQNIDELIGYFKELMSQDKEQLMKQEEMKGIVKESLSNHEELLKSQRQSIEKQIQEHNIDQQIIEYTNSNQNHINHHNNVTITQNLHCDDEIEQFQNTQFNKSLDIHSIDEKSLKQILILNKFIDTLQNIYSQL